MYNYCRKKEQFFWLLEFKMPINDLLLLKCLILVDKYYPDYKIGDFGEPKVIWNDFALDLNADYFSDLKKRIETVNFRLYFDMPFFIQKDGAIQSIMINDSMKINVCGDKYSTDVSNSLILDLHADLFTDVVIVSFPWPIEDVGEDQSLAARQNRSIFTSFLKDLQVLFDGIVTEYSSHYLTENSIFEYGIKEDAKYDL